MQTDCLSKESKVLASFPILAKERKVILVELSKLVGCARTASGMVEQADAAINDAAKAMEALAKAARGVFASVKRFLQLADDCGVKPIPADTGGGGKVNIGSLSLPMSNAQPPPAVSVEAARVREVSTGNARIQEAFRARAASIGGDFRAARRRASSPPPPVPTAPDLGSMPSGRARSPSAASTPMSATFASSSGSGRSSPISVKSSRDPHLHSGIESSPHHLRATSSDLSQHRDSVSMPTPSNSQLGSTPEVQEAITCAEDVLLSIIAAFIGHIHSHNIGSHPSSHAHLIEMTRETIDAVRELLTIVEAVGRNRTLRLSRPREVEHLRVSKDSLYNVASRLVEGAEALADAPFSEVGEDLYDIEKARLLQTATGTLRAGTECVRLVRLCLLDEDALQLQATPRQGGAEVRQSTPRRLQEAAVVTPEKAVGEGGAHTLATLQHKAASLGNLQKRYQQDGKLVQPPSEDETNDERDEDNEEVVQDAARDEDMTLRPVTQVSSFPTPSFTTAVCKAEAKES